MPVETSLTHGGQRLRVVFSGAKGNILTIQLLRELTAILQRASDVEQLKMLTIEGMGLHFSYGASIEEHRREHAAEMLDAIGGAARALVHCDVPTAALVRGQCLGGGLELAMACQRIIPTRDAVFAQPEIRLGVFAPIASILLPLRVGLARAEEMLVSGRSVNAREAAEWGLTEDACHEPEGRIGEVVAEMANTSASSLRFVVRAGRGGMRRDFDERLTELETMYLTELMETKDANDGIEGFFRRRGEGRG